MQFVHEVLPTHVVFGSGAVEGLGKAMTHLGVSRAMLLATPRGMRHARAVTGSIDARIVGCFAGAVMHTPVAVTEEALMQVRGADADCLIAFGGGSTIGLGKALALRTDLPQIVIPTTYAGSEMTPILGETENGRKLTQRNCKVMPEVVIYDPDLTLDLPGTTSGTSGINAIAHAVEGLYARDASPVIHTFAEQGIRALAQALPVIARDGRNKAAREQALYGAWLCGTVLGTVGMALHHKLCHTLGGDFNLPHAETHTIVLPHAVAYNAPSIPQAIATLRRALESDAPAQALFDLGRAVGAPQGLRELGMAEAGIDQAADHAMENAYWNPHPLEREPLRRLIARAWAGERPQ
jgi:maleylacetate reductase